MSKSLPKEKILTKNRVDKMCLLSRQVRFDRFVVDFFSTKSIHKKKRKGYRIKKREDENIK